MQRKKGKTLSSDEATAAIPAKEEKFNLDEELQSLYTQALDSGMADKTVRQCFSSEVYSQSSLRKSTGWRLFTMLFLPVVAAVVFRGQITDYLSESQCLIDTNPFVMEMARPLANCSAMCSGLENGVPAVEDISAQRFLEDHARTAKPLLVTGVAKKWKALERFSYAYFKKLYMENKKALKVNEEECQFFTYGCNITTLTELFEMTDKRARLEEEPWYIGWSNCEKNVKSILREAYEHPHFLPTSDSDEENLDWIFMGASGPGAFIHLDSVEKPSWQAQIMGSKTWVLHPVPECEDVCPGKLEVKLRKGDIVFVDTNKWYHSTVIHPGEMSITIGSEYSDDV